MKHECVVGTRLPKELVKELETIERVEHADRSTTLRKLLTSAVELETRLLCTPVRRAKTHARQRRKESVI